ncbi:helix-turn-helix transcriptional regulator, partial [Bradyrhizobium uaiense]|uniref:helix-turn-helix transcriptional regulator n=1 Tax=Bradyrhizobium uaiense TaxID=2594946 RepID=UPI001F430AAB
TNREIGECLSIGLATVKTHLIHIFEKLGVETRSAVVALMSRPLGSSTAVSGILDHPLSRVMTPRMWLAPLSLADGDPREPLS